MMRAVLRRYTGMVMLLVRCSMQDLSGSGHGNVNHCDGDLAEHDSSLESCTL